MREIRKSGLQLMISLKTQHVNCSSNFFRWSLYFMMYFQSLSDWNWRTIRSTWQRKCIWLDRMGLATKGFTNLRFLHVARFTTIHVDFFRHVCKRFVRFVMCDVSYNEWRNEFIQFHFIIEDGFVVLRYIYLTEPFIPQPSHYISIFHNVFTFDEFQVLQLPQTQRLQHSSLQWAVTTEGQQVNHSGSDPEATTQCWKDDPSDKEEPLNQHRRQILNQWKCVKKFLIMSVHKNYNVTETHTRILSAFLPKIYQSRYRSRLHLFLPLKILPRFPSLTKVYRCEFFYPRKFEPLEYPI